MPRGGEVAITNEMLATTIKLDKGARQKNSPGMEIMLKRLVFFRDCPRHFSDQDRVR